MSEETITKDRSPRSPSMTLEDAIVMAGKLHHQARSAAISPDAAVNAIGYKGMSGAAMSALASLTQYGLIVREKGKLTVTPLAVKILHSTSSQQKEDAIREAATAPQIFNEMLKGYEDCAAPVIASHLVQNDFAPDRARKVAEIYTTNKAFAKLGELSIAEKEEENGKSAKDDPPPPPPKGNTNTPAPGNTALVPPNQKVLAQYTIPLGENQATLVFTGQKQLAAEDFDDLIDFVTFSKRQFVRAQKSAQSTPANQEDA